MLEKLPAFLEETRRVFDRVCGGPILGKPANISGKGLGKPFGSSSRADLKAKKLGEYPMENRLLTTQTNSNPSLNTDSPSRWLNRKSFRPHFDEHDSCAIVASVRKTGEATHGNLKRALAALGTMGHRSGEVNGEEMGAGADGYPHRLGRGVGKDGKPFWLAEDPGSLSGI
jgi:hypothetical protein